MLLAVDIGNSTISTGLFGLDGELRCFSFTISAMRM